MDLTVAALGGAVAKVYDDLTEGGFIKDGIFKQSLFTLSCFLLAALAHNDFIHTFSMYFLNLCNHFADDKAFAENPEKSLLYIYPIFLLLNYQSAQTVPLLDVGLLILSFLFAAIEPILIKEEVSLRKCLLRCLTVIFAIGLYYFSKLQGVHTGIQKTIIYAGAYFFVSSLSQAYQLLNMKAVSVEEGKAVEVVVAAVTEEAKRKEPEEGGSKESEPEEAPKE